MKHEPSLTRLIEEVCQEQRQRWQAGERLRVEEYLRRYPELAADTACAVELVFHEILLSTERGETPQLHEYAQRFPQLVPQLRLLLEVDREIKQGRLLSRTTLASTQPALEGSAN